MMRHRQTALLACAALFPLLLVSGRAMAQEAGAAASEETTVLQKLTVKGGRKGVAETPLASTTTEEAIDAKQISTIEDLGRADQPGVGFNRTTGAVNIRGLEGPRVTTTIDGIAIPYLQDGARDADGGPNSFDFNGLSSIDVVRGADSSRLGDGALGGALVLRTIEPEDLISEGKSWGGIFKFTYAGEDDSFGGSAAVATRFDNTAVLFQGGLKKGHERETGGDLDVLGTTRTEANPADFDQNNLLFKVKQYTDSGHTFTLTGERFDRDKTIDLKREQLEGGNYRPGNWNGRDDIKRDRVSLNYEFEAVDDDALLDAANAVFYWQGLTTDNGKNGYRYTSVVGDYSRLSEINNRSFGGNGSLEKQVETGALHHTIRLGGDFSGGKTTQYSSGVDSCAVAPVFACGFLHTNQADSPDVRTTKFGIFLEDEIGFGDSAFSLTPGLRYDWYKQAPQDTPGYAANPNYKGLPPGQDGDALSPKLLAKYDVSQDVQVYAQWAMGFRSPTASELYLNYGAPGSYLNIGNPNLKPETSNGFELGTKLGDEDFGANITGFYNRYRNFIDSVGLTTDEQIALGLDPADYAFVNKSVNLERVRIYGIELSARKRFDSGFHLNGSLTYANGVNLETDEKLGSVAPLKGVIGAGYATDVWGSDITFIAAKGVSDNTDATFKAPGYGLVDLTGWWKPERVEGLTVRAGVYNLFDKEYYDAINVRDVTAVNVASSRGFYSEPGRTFKISLTQRF